MLTRNHGLIVFLLFAVVGHASLTDRWFGKAAPWWHLGFALILLPILLVLFGEWIAADATTMKWHRRGWGLALLGAFWHLVLDAACLWLPFVGAPEWKAGVAGAAVGAVVMGLVLRRAWRGFFDPQAPEPEVTRARTGETRLQRIARELSLLGGTPIAVFLISVGFVAMATVGLLRHPHNAAKLLWAGGFFVLCGAVAVRSGLERRALLLRRPSPFARLRLRLPRRAVMVATQEGLAQLTKDGAQVYPWEAIVAVGLGEVYGNAALLVTLLDTALAVRIAVPGKTLSSEARFRKREAFHRSVQRVLTDSDLAILGVMTQEGPGALGRQIEEALSDEAARAALPPVATALDRFTARAGR